MSRAKRYTFIKILVAIVWVLVGSGTVVLLIAAITRKNSEHCASIEINISGVQNNFFVDKKDVLEILQKTNGRKLEMTPMHSIDLALMEAELQKTQWIKKAELFFDNNNVLQVRITEREPVARIFTSSGRSFYLDSSLLRLPLSDKFSARLPVFTNFPTDVIVLSHADSNLITDIKTLGTFIATNPFWMAQIDQVDILPGGTFDLIPKLGNQVIHFGKAVNYHEKFNNLLCFYKQVLAKKGWSQYSSLNVEFAGQVVGVRRGVGETKADSLRAIQIMKAIIADAQKHTNDSTNIQLQQPEDNNGNINTSTERDDIPDEDVNGNLSTASKNRVFVAPIHVPEKPIFEKSPAVKKYMDAGHQSHVEPSHGLPAKSHNIKGPSLKSPENVIKKPKAVMPSASDY